MSSVLNNAADSRRLPKRAAVEESDSDSDQAEEGSNPDLSADEIMNRNFNPVYEEDGKTIDETIAAANTGEAALHAAKDGEVNFDMDMNMAPSQFEQAYGNGDSNTTARMANDRLAGVGFESDYYRWPKAIIPYKIDPQFDQNDRDIIYKGMQMWMKKTCIRFVKPGSAEARSTGHNHHIYIFSGKGCYSPIGYQHGRDHRVSLQRRSPGYGLGSCMLPGIVAHELGHTIGLHHEQCRNDRDEHLLILTHKVSPNQMRNFQKQSTRFSFFDTPYDYCSVMHYGPRSFGIDGGFTMVPKDLGYLSVIGAYNRGSGLTGSDANIVNKMYNCGITAAQTPCPKKPCTDRFPAAVCQQLQQQLNQGQNGLSQYGSGQNGRGQNGRDQYGQGRYGQGRYGQGRYGQGRYGQGRYGQGRYGQGLFGSRFW